MFNCASLEVPKFLIPWQITGSVSLERMTVCIHQNKPSENYVKDVILIIFLYRHSSYFSGASAVAE